MDNPGLFKTLSTPALMEKAVNTEAALEELLKLQGAMESALHSVRTTMRNSQPPLDLDVVTRMERLLEDGLAY